VRWVEGYAGSVRPTVLLLFTVALLYMAIVRIPIPDALIGAYLTMLGFYFGSRNAQKEAEQSERTEARLVDALKESQPKS
jgi:hypothetical protein